MNTLAKDIIKEWGLESLPQNKRAEVVERIGRMIYQAILVRSLDILSEKEQNEFDKLLDNDETTPQDVMAFLHSKIPTFEMLLGEEREKLKTDMLSPVAA
jgi:hypothetical protein